MISDQQLSSLYQNDYVDDGHIGKAMYYSDADILRNVCKCTIVFWLWPRSVL